MLGLGRIARRRHVVPHCGFTVEQIADWGMAVDLYTATFPGQAGEYEIAARVATGWVTVYAARQVPTGRLAGFANVEDIGLPDYAMFNCLGVAPVYRGCGVGRALVAGVVKEAGKTLVGKLDHPSAGPVAAARINTFCRFGAKVLVGYSFPDRNTGGSRVLVLFGKSAASRDDLVRVVRAYYGNRVGGETASAALPQEPVFADSWR